MTFALASLAALALPLALHAASAEHGRHVHAVADCAAALRIALPDAHITAARAVPSNDSLRALGQKPYCRKECRQYKGGSLVNKPLRGGPCRAFTNPGGLWNGSLALYGRIPGGLDPAR